MKVLYCLVGLFSLCSAENLRGYYINEKDSIIQNYVITYATNIYYDILSQMSKNNIIEYSFTEFGCMEFTEDMKNTEIIIPKKKTIRKPIFKDNGIDYMFKVYSCYSHFMALNLFKKERNMMENKNDYIPTNVQYNHFKYYYFEDLELYNIDTGIIQQGINDYLLEIFDDVVLTDKYENCCRIYTLRW
jgi:hypothetical protein